MPAKQVATLRGGPELPSWRVGLQPTRQRLARLTFSWFHTHTLVLLRVFSPHLTVSRGGALCGLSRYCSRAVEVPSESQPRRTSIHRYIYWTLLIQGSPLSFTAIPPVPSPSARGPPPRACGGGSGEGAAKIRRLSTGPWPSLVPRLTLHRSICRAEA